MPYLIYCRPGFEHDLASEATDKWPGTFLNTKSDSGYALWHAEGYPEEDAACLKNWIFARQVLSSATRITDLPETDRITPILPMVFEVLENNKNISDVYVETPDTNQGKELSAFCKSFANAFIARLKKEGFTLNKNFNTRLHLFFIDYKTVFVAKADVTLASSHHMGIPRLKFPQDAPSRSTLKLEEALLTFLSHSEQSSYLKAGLTAVDLGASPGGWTYQLVKRGLYVTAVDHASMNEDLMNSGMVQHLKENGLKWLPPKKVHWLVCDMVERPALVAAQILEWLHAGYFDHCIFNLKLPMKKRYAELKKILTQFPDSVQCKQLYHDREEVTVYVKS